MGKVRVKICGITTVDDALAAIDAGADAIGLNMVSGPRKIGVPRAVEVLKAVGGQLTPVILVNAADQAVCDESLGVARRHAVQTLQVYGDDRGEQVARIGREGFDVWLPHAVQPDRFPDSLSALLAELPDPPAGIVLDAFHDRLAGGTGITVDWELVRDARDASVDWPPLILAGGLTPNNVAKAIDIVRPYAVDVSSGVESQPGRKDAELMARFVEAVRIAQS